MQHILVPIGSSVNSKNTLQYAIDLASEFGAKIFVFRAYKVRSKAGAIINMDEIVERETGTYVREAVEGVDQKNVEVKVVTAKGGTIESIASVHNEFGVDLIIMGPKSNTVKAEQFLGSTSGSIVKRTDIPVLIVPEGYQFTPFKRVLTAFKSGKLNRDGVLNPLQKIVEVFNTEVNLLLVKTPDFTEGDSVLDGQLTGLQDTLTTTENATTFQGVLEHFQSNQPDLLCVFKRKRGFFQKLWEKNAILKSEFHCSIPLLVLRGKL